MINELNIFQSIKKWIQLYGINILDLLLPVLDDTSTDPVQRYALGDVNLFGELFNKHFSLVSYYEEQVGYSYPYLGVKIDELSDSDSCFAVYRITFVSEFSTVSPKSEQLCIGNTPEDILQYYDELECALYDMMKSMYEDLKIVENLTFVPADLHFSKYSKDPIQTSNEIFTRRFPFDMDAFLCG